MIVTVTLNPTTDIITPLNKLVPGSVIRSKQIYSYPAGKGTNTARALAALGSDVTAVGFTAAAQADEIKSFLKKHEVKPDFISVPGTNRLCLLITGKKEETVINGESNLCIGAGHRSLFLKKLKILSKKTCVFIFSGSLPLSLPQNFYADCISSVKNNSTVILDASGKCLREGIKSGPHILKQNIHELESAFKVKLAAAADLRAFMKKLSKKYRINTVITTLNEKGSVLFDSGEFHYFKPLKVKKIVSPVGSGDAYSAGLAYGIEKGMSMPASCKLAAACAAANLENKGSCFFSAESVTIILKSGL